MNKRQYSQNDISDVETISFDTDNEIDYDNGRINYISSQEKNQIRNGKNELHQNNSKDIRKRSSNEINNDYNETLNSNSYIITPYGSQMNNSFDPLSTPPSKSQSDREKQEKLKKIIEKKIMERKLKKLELQKKKTKVIVINDKQDNNKSQTRSYHSFSQNVSQQDIANILNINQNDVINQNDISDNPTDAETTQLNFDTLDNSLDDSISDNDNLLNNLTYFGNKSLSTKQITFNNTLSITKKVDDSEIEKRLNKSYEFVKRLSLENGIEGFYLFMSFVERSYPEIPNSNFISGDIRPTVDEIANINMMLNYLQREIPNPNNTGSSYRSNDMFKLRRLIPVGDTTSNDAPLFYCILDNDNTIDKRCVISYVDRRIIDNKRYIIRKYTDRITMRSILIKTFNGDNNKIDFALFILENLHFITVHKKYIKIGENTIVFDLYSLIQNVFNYYDTNNRLLDYIKIKNELKEKDLLKANLFIKDIGLNYNNYSVNDDNTIAYIFWLYKIKYLVVDYKDQSWVNKIFNIKTTLSSNIKKLASYQIYKDYGKDNILNIDSDYTIEYDINIPGIDISKIDISKFNPSNDLKTFYESRNEEEQLSIRKYLYIILSSDNLDILNEMEENKINLSFIYPLIYKSISNDTDYINNFIDLLTTYLPNINDSYYLNNIIILDIVSKMFPKLPKQDIIKSNSKEVKVFMKKPEIIKTTIFKLEPKKKKVTVVKSNKVVSIEPTIFTKKMQEEKHEVKVFMKKQEVVKPTIFELKPKKKKSMNETFYVSPKVNQNKEQLKELNNNGLNNNNLNTNKKTNVITMSNLKNNVKSNVISKPLYETEDIESINNKSIRINKDNKKRSFKPLFQSNNKKVVNEIKKVDNKKNNELRRSVTLTDSQVEELVEELFKDESFRD